MIAKPFNNSYIQVHTVSKGKTVGISTTDMVMFHLREGIASPGDKTISINKKMKRMLFTAYKLDHK